jgi:hypothetical protein
MGPGGPGGYQRFDSLAVDSADNICVATLINGGITAFSPDGRPVRHIPMPGGETVSDPQVLTLHIHAGGQGVGLDELAARLDDVAH